MAGSLLDGKHVAAEISKTLKETITTRLKEGHRAPSLAVILLGDDPASFIYVNSKRQACQTLGFQSFAYDLPRQTSEHALLVLIDQLNASAEIDGILVQLPLPAHINTTAVLERINPAKDVDGFHPYNLGRLAQGAPLLRPCTPYGIIQLLKYYQLPLVGKSAVIVGASNIVGRPMACELLLAKATVTVCHRATKNLAQHIRQADLVIVAAGVVDVVPVEWLQSHQIVVDVGIHRLADQRIRGDVDFEQAQDKVAWITPVPGGVGPMTICTLLQNTLLAAAQSSLL